MSNNTIRHPASFRDPSGFVFTLDGKPYRQINHSYLQTYETLKSSGLYARLVKEALLIPHTEVDDISPPVPETAALIIKPEEIPFISYAYEWPFSFLKEAALITLRIQKIALEYGMTLKDASAYNIQWYEGRPIFIDTLSFETYQEGCTWDAYRQFCQHFLAPLALMAYKDIRLGLALRVHLDGIPLDLTSSLLPLRSYFHFGLLTHIHLHARTQKQYLRRTSKKTERPSTQHAMSRAAMIGLIESLESTIQRLQWEESNTLWGTYYQQTNYTEEAFQYKKSIVSQWIEQISPSRVLDIGANDGTFSRLATAQGIFTIALDLDPLAVEKNYRRARREQEKYLLPLLLDVTNPSPALGWQAQERSSFFERTHIDLVLALAFLHHLAIGNNIPLESIAQFFSRLSLWLIVEFVPKEDSQVQLMLRDRKDIFEEYSEEMFIRSFSKYFDILQNISLPASMRKLYLMKRKHS